MLFRWFIGLSIDAPVWDVTVFTTVSGCWQATWRCRFCWR
jgi:hypothetical protein